MRMRQGIDFGFITLEVKNMEKTALLRSEEPLAHSPFIGSGCEIWNSLRTLKEEVSLDLLREGSLCQSEILGLREGEESTANTGDIEWCHRAQLEARLREITDAQDRLLDGTYGKCVDCGEQISVGRLMADPAASLCLTCQKLVERQHQFARRKGN